MAFSPKLFSFFFLVALVSSPLALRAVHAAREGQQYFAKASPTTATTSTFLEEDQEEPDSTAFRSKAQTFASDNQLYANNDNSYYSTNTRPEPTYNHHPTTFASNTKSAYEPNNYREAAASYKPTGVSTHSKPTRNPTTGTKDIYSLSADELANYYSIDNTVLNKNYQSSKVATVGQESNIDNYNEYRFGAGNKKSSGEQHATRQMGMSDTRFLGNGRYFYNINNDRTTNVNSAHVSSTKAVFNQETYNPMTTTTKGRAWGNRNSQAQDDDEEGDEILP